MISHRLPVQSLKIPLFMVLIEALMGLAEIKPGDDPDTVGMAFLQHFSKKISGHVRALPLEIQLRRVKSRDAPASDLQRVHVKALQPLYMSVNIDPGIYIPYIVLNHPYIIFKPPGHSSLSFHTQIHLCPINSLSQPPPPPQKPLTLPGSPFFRADRIAVWPLF